MSDNRFVLDGLDELREQLLKLPVALADKAQTRIQRAAAIAVMRIKDGYPARTGNLRGHVYASVTRDGVSVVATVKNTAKHAWLFEHGSQARHTDLGANRGSMPAQAVFTKIMPQERRAMFEDLKAIVADAGLEVSGDAG